MDQLVTITDTIDTYMYTYFQVFLLIFAGLHFAIRAKDCRRMMATSR